MANEKVKPSAGSKSKAKAAFKAKQKANKTEVGEKGAKAKAKSSKGNADDKNHDPAEETTEVKQEEPETTGDESRRQYTRKWYNVRHKKGIAKLPANKQLCQFGKAVLRRINWLRSQMQPSSY